MGFDIAFGLIFVVTGLALLLFAWANPAPLSHAFVRFLVWPRKDQDRMDVALNGLLHVAFGGFIMVSSVSSSRLLWLAPMVVLAAASIALGVRRRDS